MGIIQSLFQSTLPRREWRTCIHQVFNIPTFQSTLPRREWLRWTENGIQLTGFQSTLPRREWHGLHTGMTTEDLFQSTLPRREWLSISFFFAAHDKFQSTLPRREWRWNGWTVNQSVNFNPHSREGSDLDKSIIICFKFYFNPHSREGSDSAARSSSDKINLISIHTPAKGVTEVFSYAFFKAIYFNPHSREGSDASRIKHINLLEHFNPHSREGSDAAFFLSPDNTTAFQSTLPRREWRKVITSISSGSERFQSTLPRREWLIWEIVISRKKLISIHTPAKGVTQCTPYFVNNTSNFNPHSREGSDLQRRWNIADLWNFNPHSREGSDRVRILPGSTTGEISIHTPAKGVTQSHSLFPRTAGISIHTPAKGVTMTASR